MQEKTFEATSIIVACTLIFLLAPAFLLLYINSYNRRKKLHTEEKELLKKTFEAELLKTQIEIQEQTLQTIGSDLHDNIGQLLSLTNLTLKSIEVEDPDKTQQKIRSVIELTSRSIQELRQLGKLLQGEQLISQGLQSAIHYELKWLGRSDRFQIDYDKESADEKKLDFDKELIVFRLFQEIINNIIKHAEASQISVKLNFAEDKFILDVWDNGKGFNIERTKEQSSGMGLYNIYKRAKIIGGEACITSEPGSGTHVCLTVPN